MRSHSNDLAEDETEPWFCDDVEGGGCLVQCGNCQTETTNDDRCPTCDKWFVYRPWWSW